MSSPQLRACRCGLKRPLPQTRSSVCVFEFHEHDSAANRLRSGEEIISLEIEEGSCMNAQQYEGLMDAVKASTVLEVLKIADCLVPMGWTRGLASALETNSSLQELSIEKMKVYGGGAADIARGVEAHTALKSLFLDYSEIGDEGATHLARMLRSSSALTSLSLLDPSIGERGAQELSAVLSSDHSPIAWLGIIPRFAYAKIFRQNSKIRSLAIHSIPGPEGFGSVPDPSSGLELSYKPNVLVCMDHPCIDMLRELEGNTAVESITYRGFSDSTFFRYWYDRRVTPFAQLMRRNRTIRSLSLCPPPSQAAMRQLVQALHECPREHGLDLDVWDAAHGTKVWGVTTADWEGCPGLEGLRGDWNLKEIANFIQAKHKEKMMAWFMGLHHRAGQCSPVRILEGASDCVGTVTWCYWGGARPSP